MSSTGSGVTSIEDSNGITLNVNATALTDNTALSLSGTAGFTVTGLQGDITATGVSGSLNVTTVAVASGLSIATGSGSNTITASALTTGQTLTLTGGSAATVTLNGGASTGSLAAGTYTGNLTVTGGSGANTITAGNGTNTITGGGGADALTGGTGSDTFNFSSAANLGAATTIAGGAGNDTIQMTAAATLTDASFLHAASIETLGLTGASTITLGANAAGAGLVKCDYGDWRDQRHGFQRRHAQCRSNGAGTKYGADAGRVCGGGGDRTGRGYHGRFADRRADGDDRRCHRQRHQHHDRLGGDLDHRHL